MKTIRKKTMCELKDAIYKANGWMRKAGESMSERVKAHYDVRVDHQRAELVATPKQK